VNRYNPNSSAFYSKKLSPMELYALGIPSDNLDYVHTLDELRNSPPNIIIADCKKYVRFLQNKFRQQELKKKNKYVMSLGVYLQLHYDTRNNIDILKPSTIQFKKIYKHYNGQNLDNKTLLVFRQGGIGDLLFIQPNLIHLKEKYPTSTIRFACGPQYQSMVNEWDCIDKVLDLPFLVNEMFNSDYHCVFEGVIERCKEAENTCSYNLFSKWMGLNLSDENLIPKQTANKELVEKCKEILKELNIEEKNFIVLQMSASSPIRTPSETVWKNLIDLLTDKGYNILITDSPYKSSDIDKFIKLLKNKDRVKNFCQYSTTIAHTIALVSLSSLIIATDSALNHIAESLDIKSFSIMGPFPGKIRFSTYRNNDWIDVSRDGCSPCFQHGMKPCKYSISGYSPCYNNIDYDICIEKIERLLKK
jgi:ADP-heptose:LPS heptosyltransferase